MAVSEEGERAGGDDPGVELLEGSCGGVARVGEGGETLLVALLVHGCEGGIWHEDFAADFEYGRDGKLGLLGSKMQPLLECEGNVSDGADVLGDIVAGGAVAAGGSVFQGAVFVEKGDGDTVDFRLHRYGDFLAAEVFLEAFVECDEFGFGNLRVLQFKHIVDAEHRHWVGDLGEGGVRDGADALGGGVRLGEFGVGFLEILKFAVELVVFGVADLRLRLGVVEVIVVIEKLPELGYSRFGRG